MQIEFKKRTAYKKRPLSHVVNFLPPRGGPDTYRDSIDVNTHTPMYSIIYKYPYVYVEDGSDENAKFVLEKITTRKSDEWSRGSRR
jgi:hypothetical protein